MPHRQGYRDRGAGPAANFPTAPHLAEHRHRQPRTPLPHHHSPLHRQHRHSTTPRRHHGRAANLHHRPRRHPARFRAAAMKGDSRSVQTSLPFTRDMVRPEVGTAIPQDGGNRQLDPPRRQDDPAAFVPTADRSCTFPAGKCAPYVPARAAQLKKWTRWQDNSAGHMSLRTLLR